MRKKLFVCLLSMTIVLASAITANACTAVYVGEDASADGSAYIARSEDLQQNHNKIFKVIPAMDREEGSTYKDPDGFVMDYPEHTYRYTVNIDDPNDAGGIHDYPEVGFNENNVYVSATVSTGYDRSYRNIDPLVRGGVTEISIASVMLQEATSARNAMEILARVIDAKGANECNLILAADGNETWMMEILSGHQYAAVKLRSDEVATIPNFMVLDNVGRYEDYIVSDGLLETAQKANKAVFIDPDKPTVENLLVAESYTSGFTSTGNTGRFWGGAYLMNKAVAAVVDPATLQQLPEHKAFYKPDHKISLEEVMNIEGFRYEGTEYEGSKYRTIGELSQMEIHIAQIRKNMEEDLAGIQWQAFANGEFTVYIPYFTNLITDTHESYKVESLKFNEDSYYWNFEKVMQLCASDRANYGAPVKAFWKEYQQKLFDRQKEIDVYMQYTPAEERSEAATKLGMDMAEDVFKTEVAIRKQLEAHIASAPGTPFVIQDIDCELPEIVYAGADYSQVDALIEEAGKLDAELYKNYEAVEDAIRAVDHEKNFTQQDEVNAMATEIKAAIEALEYKDADYSKVDDAIKNAESLNPKDYKDFSAVDEALDAVVRGKNITEQSEVDAMAEAINDAVASLEKIEKQPVIGGNTGNGDNTENGNTENGNTENGDNTETDGNPTTGDTAPIALYAGLALMAGAGILFANRKARSEK